MDFKRLYAELEQSTEMIRALVSGISQEDARRRPAPDSWSVLEVICHLYDLEREDFREHIDFILYRQQEEWHVIDPQSWVTERRYNQQDVAGMTEKFLAERQRSLEWLSEAARADWETTYTSEYGSKSAGEMLACWVAHDNLHIRQLVELRRARIEDITRPYSLDYAGEW